jgi:hypothetical protein
MTSLTKTLALLSAIPFATAATLDDTLAELRESLVYGKPSAMVRLRYETVDQDGLNPAIRHDAYAATMRAAFGYETKPFHGFSFFGEYEGVFAFNDHYNDTVNGKTQYPTVADPEDVELNQAWGRYAPGYLPRTSVTVGRQEINLDNQRYVGAVGWRQNWQSFDAVVAKSSWYQPVSVTYAYLDHVHRIFSNNNIAQGDFDLEDSHLLNIAWKAPVGTLTGYAYLVGFDKNLSGLTAGQTTTARGVLNQSSQTYGARFTGSQTLNEDWNALYAAEYAHQSDYGEQGLFQIDADYYLLEAGASWRNIALKGGREALGGSGTVGDKFTTPLATLHAFNGWADLFLTTPDNGLIDDYVSLGGPIPDTLPVVGKVLDGLTAQIAYHRFTSDSNDKHYGDEWDALLQYAVKRFDPKLIVGTKYAYYQADDSFVDTRKLWLYTQYSF